MTSAFGTWLEQFDLGQHADLLQEAEVDFDVLRDLDENDLRELGLPLGARKKLLRARDAICSIGAEMGRTTKAPTSSKPEEAKPPSPSATPIGLGATQAERRQLTVMFVDLVGSTAMASRFDPEEMRSILTIYQNVVAGVITRFEGYVAKYMGDGVLAYFGWPQAHEDEVDRAVRAALEITEAVSLQSDPEGRTQSCRIGIATGLVVVGDLVGEGAAQEQAVVGATPNLAARLQALAEPNGVVLAESTRRLLGEDFSVTCLGPKQLKGIPEPVEAFAVVGVSAASSRFDARGGNLLPMVGRDQELALLLERWEQAKANEGQAVLLVGEAGIGKSRITRALLDALKDEPHHRIRYQCSPYHADSAFWPVIRQIVSAARFSEDDGEEQKLDKLEALLLQANDRSAAPLVANLLGLDGIKRYGVLDLEPHAQRARTLEALNTQLIRLAEKKPTLLVVEDTHWIDPTTLELVGQALDRIADHPVLMLLTSRPENQPELAGHPHVTRLSLNRLSRSGIEAIVNRLSGETLNTATIDTIIARTDGVPLYVEELTKAIVETGDTAIPASLHDSLMARLDRIPEVKEIAQTAACIGRDFDQRLLESVADKLEVELAAGLDRLVAAELIFKRGTPPEALYTFKHALVRDAAYGSILRGKRKLLHERIATTLLEDFNDIVVQSPETLAHHFHAAGRNVDASKAWLSAGKRAAAISAESEAFNHLERGLEALSSQENIDGVRELELNLLLEACPLTIPLFGHMSERANALHQRALLIAKQLKNNHALVDAYNGLGRIYENIPDFRAMKDVVDQLTENNNRDHDIVCDIASCRLAMQHSFWTGDLKKADTQSKIVINTVPREKEHALSLKLGLAPSSFAFVYRAMINWVAGRPDLARTLADAAIARSNELSHASSRIHSYGVSSIVSYWRRDVDRTHDLAKRTLTLSENHGFSNWRQLSRALMTWVDGQSGNLDGAIPSISACSSITTKFSGHLLRPWLCSMMADLGLKQGQHDECLVEIDACIEMSRRTELYAFLAELHRLRGCMLLAIGRERDCVTKEFRTAIRIARDQGAGSWELRAAKDFAGLQAEEGQRQRAIDILRPVYDRFSEGFETPDLDEARQLLVELS